MTRRGIPADDILASVPPANRPPSAAVGRWQQRETARGGECLNSHRNMLAGYPSPIHLNVGRVRPGEDPLPHVAPGQGARLVGQHYTSGLLAPA
ncbi:hypothetical protein SKAU_G00111640 [Synaphobranchus kaupii]|uniref:Uncharacterized protein n=1 Tax=Synaphobranchus kaupii TaxID=118154 RepID=A0A9Q1G1P7_SYNKA|nr:hypothetical protein SKAU_G00111640 [Synaphobranchus kaupii]